ncbi:hypothetical protein NDU88_002311 [Pleurodeles waltl]|uniref:Uncharacterized protein n=1 Tax=Pleurodeles waltl TaxID=8319 RepID=A0AAV7NDB0_PLEWA|nr:hypothetical protein NDU88_002311 [Pleurodeles waltl]
MTRRSQYPSSNSGIYRLGLRINRYIITKILLTLRKNFIYLYVPDSRYVPFRNGCLLLAIMFGSLFDLAVFGIF